MPTFDSYVQGTPSWIELMAPDQGAAADFYGRLFGWEMRENPFGEGDGVYLTAHLEGSSIAGIGAHMPELEGHPAFWSVYLAADDVDAATAKVEAAGGTINAGPFDVMEHGRMVALSDPTGARVNLWQAGQLIGTERANEPGTPIWNELVTPDIEAALPFYEQVLGMGVEKMDMPSGTYDCLTDANGRVIGGAMLPPMPGLPPHWNVYFNVASADATIEKAVALGGQVLAPAFDVPGVGRMAVLADPQGGMFNLMENLPAAE
jgi:uncharacterized protein